MFRIAYTSRLNPAVGRAEIESVLEQSRARNRRDGVTGAWLMKGYDCLASLEGPPEAVRAATERIWDDRRHDDFRLRDMRATTLLLFKGWDLYFVDMEAASVSEIEAHDGLRWLCGFAGGVAAFKAHGLPQERDGED